MFCSTFTSFATILNKQEENGPLLWHQGGLLYKTHLTATVFKDFSSCYQHLNSTKNSHANPFVYVDATGVKLVTDVIDDESGEGIFALSVAQDGWVEMLAINEAS